jgi:hypothetical protein
MARAHYVPVLEGGVGGSLPGVPGVPAASGDCLLVAEGGDGANDGKRGHKQAARKCCTRASKQATLHKQRCTQAVRLHPTSSQKKQESQPSLL